VAAARREIEVTDTSEADAEALETLETPAEDNDRPRLLRVLRGQGDGFDMRNTWQVAVGAVLMPLGIVIILIAWYGAAHASHVQQQIPYLVSGAFIGLGLMIVGGLLYWAHWLYRVYDQADLHHQDMLRQQDEHMRALIAAVSGAQSNGHAPRRAARTAPASAARFVATGNGTNFHLPDCPVVARNRRNVRAVNARDVERMQPCRICDPLQAAAQT
jgi:hypothetical protein